MMEKYVIMTIIISNRPQFIQKSRIQSLNNLDVHKGKYILYWMQQSQRAEYNHALEYAVQTANHLRQPLLVAFGLTTDYPEANLRHYTFLLEGLRETQATLASRGIKMIVRTDKPDAVALTLGNSASIIVCDRGYLRHQKAWRSRVAAEATCRVVQVESDLIVPVQTVSEKAEYAARTIRPKIHRQLDMYLVRFKHHKPSYPSIDLKVKGIPLKRTDSVLKALTIDRSVPPISNFLQGGTSVAKAKFRDFLQNRLSQYEQHHNQPQTDDISHMGPYLHFGQISPLYLALRLKSVDDHLRSAKDAYLEELIVRRELAANFVHYTSSYDTYECVPNWARQSLADHRPDIRRYIYSREQLEAAKTHDPYWNAAMREMKFTGFMHNYMRMYWGKKILAWSETPEEAFQTTLAINNKYFVDGRDPNSYAGVGWIYGLHDRAWPERPIFGKIRYMTASGLERKCNISAYVDKVEKRIAQNQK